MRAADFDYLLPPDRIAHTPAPSRDQSRLLVLNRASPALAHRTFSDIGDILRPGDLLVLNNSRVIPARLSGIDSEGKRIFEILLLEPVATNQWWAMLRPGKHARIQNSIRILDSQSQPSGIDATVLEINPDGHRLLSFADTKDIARELNRLGEVPLPPYIQRERPNRSPIDRDRYQTVYASRDGSVAAPTAGLHFTPELLQSLEQRGIRSCELTLHVGPGTFAPVKSDSISKHIMHAESFVLPEPTARAIRAARDAGGRIVAVGTTTVRVLESVAAEHDGEVVETRGRTSIFIRPPFTFRVVDALLTNFHLPRSTLLMLVSAFADPGGLAGRDRVLAAYSEAIAGGYRFYSYGDAMLLL